MMKVVGGDMARGDCYIIWWHCYLPLQIDHIEYLYCSGAQGAS